MSEFNNSNEEFNQGKEAAGKAVGAAKDVAKDGIRAGRKIKNGELKKGFQKAKKRAKQLKKKAKNAAKAASNPAILKWVLIALAVVVALVLIVKVAGGISSTFRRVFRNDAVETFDEAKDYYPKDEEEEEEALNDDDIAREDTAELALIVHETRRRDYESVQNTFEARVKAAAKLSQLKFWEDIDYDETLANAKTEFSERSHWIYPNTDLGDGNSFVSGTAEAIAQTAEKYAWPLGTSQKKYRLSRSSSASGYNGFEEMFHTHMGWPTWDGGYNDHLKRGACCCHSATAIVSEALYPGQKKYVKNLMAKPGSDGKSKKKALEKQGFEVFDYTGDEATLQRGDILSRRNGDKGHVMIYLGVKDGEYLICHGGLTNGNFPRLQKMSSLPAKGYSTYWVIRYTGEGASTAVTTTDIKTGKDYDTNSSSSDSDDDDTSAKAADAIVSGANGLIGVAYDKITTLYTIEKSKCTVKTLPKAGTYAFQSMAYYNGIYYLFRVHTGRYGSDGFVYAYDKNMKQLNRSKKEQEIGHANGSTYCTKDGMLYCVTTKYVRNHKKAQVIDPNTLEIVKEIDLPHGCSGIAYDRITNRFVLSCGSPDTKASSTGYLYVYESDLKTAAGAKTIKKKRWKTPGDICAYNGVIYVTKSGGDQVMGKNVIDMYNENTGDYLGSYNCPDDEIEGIEIDDNGQMVVLFHNHPPCIWFTGLTALGGPANQSMSGISELDMDVIAAYNISLSNTELYLDESKLSEKSDKKKGVLEKNAYRDVSGKKVSMYWWNKKKRGQINYKKDLKKKIDNIFKKDDPQVSAKSEEEKKITDGQRLANETSRSKWNLLLVNANNEIPSGYTDNITLATIPDEYLNYGSNHSDYEWDNRVDERIYGSLKNMMDDCIAWCEDEGIENRPLITSAFRTNEMQETLYNRTANKADTAIPGTGEHECGLAVDIVDSEYRVLDDAQADQKVQKWLMENCTKYGFILRYPKGKQDVTGIIWEPWHYRYVGKQYAESITKQKLTLEEYLSADPVSSVIGSETFKDDKTAVIARFYKIVIADKPEKTTKIDENGNEVEVKYIPATIKEMEVDGVMEAMFGLDPDKDYTNSQTEKNAEKDALKNNDNMDKDKKKEVKERLESQNTLQAATSGKQGSATNYEAAIEMSDQTGKFLYGDPIYVDTIDPVGTTMLLPGGQLYFPLGNAKGWTVTSNYGKRWGRMHTGVDLGVSAGTPIFAVAGGTVTRAEYYGGYGNCVDIDHGNGVMTRYAHQTKFVVKAKDKVSPGQLIGYVGNTGNSYGAHLHFEIWINGESTDPAPYIGVEHISEAESNSR